MKQQSLRISLPNRCGRASSFPFVRSIYSLTLSWNTLKRLGALKAEPMMYTGAQCSWRHSGLFPPHKDAL
eukprot:4215530-Ditylum_brightwellii.AAC.1